MDIHPTNTSSRSTAIHLQRHKPVLWLLLVLAAGLALFGLALVIPRSSMSADAAAPPTAADSQPSLQPGSGQALNLQPPTLRPGSGQASNLQSPSLLLAGVPNGGFESGALAPDWTTGGSADNVEVLEVSDWTTSIGDTGRPVPTEGDYFALLSTGHGVIGGAQGNIDLDGLATQDFDTSYLTTVLNPTASDVPATLSFDWSFLTAEEPTGQGIFDDFFRVRLNSVIILSGSRPTGGVSPFPDVGGMDNIQYTVDSPGGATDNSYFGYGRNSFQTFRMIINDPGSYTLEFMVADQGDANDDSGLLIDNVQLIPEIDLEITKTATPDPAIAGDPLVYHINVTNYGSGRALDVVVTDTLPSEVDYIKDTLPIYADPDLPQGCTFSAGSGPGGEDQLFCDMGDMLGGESVSFDIEVDVDSDALANGTLALVNTAEVDSLTADGDLRNNTIILETILQDSADLEIAKVSKPDTSVEAGETFTYTIFVDNLGPSHARNVVLTDTILSSGAFTLLRVTPDPYRSSDSCATTPTSGGTVIACALNESLEPQGDPPRNGRWVIQVGVTANYAQDVDNVVDVFSIDPDGAAGPQTATPDPDTSNNRATDFIAVTDVADLKITKIGEDDANPGVADFSVRAGERVRWTIVVVNDGGPSTSENVAVVDILPAGLVEGSVTVIGGGQCTVGTPGDPNEPLICQLGNLAPTDTATVTIRADVDPSYVVDQPNTGFANYLPNDAYLTSDTFDPDTRNNIVFDTLVEVTAEADLGIRKVDRPDYVIAGEQLEYTLTISNGGPSTAEDVVLLDELPDEVIALYVNVVNEPYATCSIRTTPANIIDCGFGNILPEKVITMVVTSLVKANTPAGPITNTATVSSLTPDPVLEPEEEDPNPNQVQQETQVETQADVEIEKTSEPVKVFAGEQKKYHIKVTNNGPSDAQDVVVYDVLPDEVEYEIDTNSPNCSQPYDLMGFRAVLNGDNEVPPVSTTATGVATFVLITDTNELIYAIEVSDITGITAAHIHMGVAGVNGPVLVTLYSGTPLFDPTRPLVGSVALNPADAAAILANPAGFYVNVHTTANPTGEIRGQMAQTVSTPLRCEIGTMTPTESREFDIWVQVRPETPPNTTIRNVAIVTSTTTLGDPDMSNNVAHSKNLVLQKADLKITKFGKPDGQVRAGEILTYTVIVDNLGPSYAGIDGRDPITGNVAIKDILQSDLEFDLLSIISDRGMVCSSVPTDGDPTDGVPNVNQHLEIDCTLLDALEVLSADGPPNPGRWIITASVTASETQDINNVVHVVSDAFDPDPDNNQAEVMHEITDVSDLEVTKAEIGEVQVDGQPGGTVTLIADQVTAGRSLTYTLVITNYGPSTAENVVLQDRLPPWIVVTGFDTSQGDCDTGTPGEPLDKLTCGLGTLAPAPAPGSSAMITITADVPSWVPEGAILENDALVYSDIFDPTNANNFATNLTTVSAWADLGISKSARGDNVTAYNEELQQFIKEQRDNEVTAGELLQYTLVVTNTGPSDAQNVVITDTLPPLAGPIATVHFVTADGATCRQDPMDRNELTCELGTMPVGDVRTVYILVRVDPAATDPTATEFPPGNNMEDILNVARVFSDTNDPYDGPPPVGSGDNNGATNTTTVNAVADIFVIKVDVPAEPRLDQPFGPDQAVAGEEHRYLITFGNNDGPSVARDVVVTDTLDLKQAGILGETFVRCEPVDPDDLVTCSEAGGIVSVDELLVTNEAIISTGTGTLNPGDEFSFYLITKVDPGYVLDADATGTEPNLIAENTAFISSSTTDVRTQNNQDTEQTEIIAEADLAVSKTDTPDPGQNLHFDPVTNKFAYTYTLTIENLGPSDAAKVVLVDTLPVDATFTGFETPEDIQCYFRDDGILFCLVGEDPNNEGTPQAGRLNVGSSKVMRIFVEADASAVAFLENCVEVRAIAEDEFPFNGTDPAGAPILPADFQDGRTPTPDPNLANNSFCETTTLVMPEVKVDKKVYVRTSPTRGIDVTTDGLTEVERCAAYAADDILTLPGDELTYCYTITNEGDTWLSSVTLGDMSDALIHRAPTSNFAVVYPAQPPLRGAITVAGVGEDQTITIETTEPEKAVLAPQGVVDDYDHILIIRSFMVDFPELGPVAGIVWEDTNGNHAVDLNEPLLAGMDVYLYDESRSQVLDDTTTDANGRYAFHSVPPERYKVWVYGGAPLVSDVSPVIEFDPSNGYSIANLDTLTGEWYIESEEYSEPIFRMLGTNTARVDAIPSTKYSTPLPGIEPSGDCVNPNLVCDTDLLHDTLALPVLEDTTKEWAIYEDHDGDGLPSPGDVIEYTVDIPNTGIIEATGNATVEFYNELYNWINDNADDLKVPGWLINGSVSAAIHVYGREPVTGRVIDADVQPPDLAFGEDLSLRTHAPAIGGGYLELTYPSAVVLDSEILLGNTPGDDEAHVATRLAIPPKGYLLRFDGVTYGPPIPVTFSLRIKYQVQLKDTKYVRLGTIVLSHGWVTWSEIGLFDQRFPDFDPMDPDAHTAANKVANNHAGTPGRAWESPEFPGWPEIPVDVEPTNYLGARFDDYALPGAPIRDDDDPTWFELVREPRRIQLPAIDNEGGWETQIQVQNGGDEYTAAIMFFWAEYSGKCPYNDPGPVGSDCMRVAENGVWRLEGLDIPSTAKSAIVYSVDEDLFRDACRDAADAMGDSAAWEDWEGEYEGTGEPIAVIVQRKGPNDHGTVVASAYPGISENMEGGGPPYQYFAPYAMRHYHNLDTEMIIQNSGQACTELWIDYQKQDDCAFSYSEHISKLTPGESIRKRVPAVLGVDWLGTAYVRANEPLGIVMDQTSFLPSEDRGALLTYEARPYKLTTDTLFFADLVWRELSGWDASIQVQNLTQHSMPTFVTVEFFDQSGDSILFLGEWVCRAGGTTFYLPAVTDLGMEYAGAAVIQSHSQVDYPGEDHDGQPIFAVVDLKKTKVYDESLPGWRHTMPGEIQGGAYNALAEGEKKEASAVMLPSLSKAFNGQGETSLIAVRNNSNCNDIELKLEIREGVGTVVSYVTDFWLSPGHIKLVDLANLGSVNPGFVGAGTVEVVNEHQLCDTDGDGSKDRTPTMLSVVVVNKAAGPGDITSVYEGIPVAYWGSP